MSSTIIETRMMMSLDKLPIEALKKLGEEFKLDRVLLIATSRKSDRTYTVSWGRTKEDCGFAAMDIQKLRAVLEAQPTSLYEATQVAKKVRPEDVTGYQNPSSSRKPT